MVFKLRQVAAPRRNRLRVSDLVLTEFSERKARDNGTAPGRIYQTARRKRDYFWRYNKELVPPKADPKGAEELALELVRNNKLTKYQAAVVYSGESKPLILVIIF